ncbi:hypothetical protein FACS1894111_09530 [Clostridia bacterium]|nr:hypothetical protein FACS1894111_09530 [Clostridia bacterium]
MQELAVADYIVFSEKAISKKEAERFAAIAGEQKLSVLLLRGSLGQSESKTYDNEELRELPFLDLLLDERLFGGVLAVKRDLLQTTGTINCRLKSKQVYELLLRLAKRFPIYAIEKCSPERILSNVSDGEPLPDIAFTRSSIKAENLQENNILIQIEESTESIKTDCYILGTYGKELQETGFFNAAVEGILAAAKRLTIEALILPYLEHMIGQDEEFLAIARDTYPILIYKGDDVCHFILTHFAQEFAAALIALGQAVEFFDVREKDLSELAHFAGRQFKAVVGVQTYLFSVKTKDGKFLHDLIGGPKYNFLFDHPIWFRNHLEIALDNLHILTVDSHYAAFIQQYYKKDALFFPPGGELPKENLEKKYPLSFVGTLGNWRRLLIEIHEKPRTERFLLNRFLLIMKKNPNMSSEAAFHLALAYYHREDEEDFFEYFHAARKGIYIIMHYFREKVLRSILDAGIILHVVGDGFANNPAFQYQNLIVHPTVEAVEGVRIMQESEISLNVMSWHKDGFTERIVNPMLGKSLVVSDYSEYLAKEFTSKTDILLYRLEHPEELPRMIKEVLQDKEKREKIAEKGYEKALAFHTWKARADEFLHLLNEDLAGVHREKP